MLSNLHISNFRSFRELHIPRLTRVNLFVGPNNAGKTSILEAAEILASGTISAILNSPRRRDEHAKEGLDVTHLFNGRVLTPEVSIRLSEQQLAQERWVECRIIQTSPALRGFEVGTKPSKEVLYSTQLLRLSSNSTDPFDLSLVDGGAPNFSLSEDGNPITFLGVGLRFERLGERWDKVVLTPEEAEVTEALKIIEPRIERIAFSSSPGSPGFFLRLQGSDQRLPLGSVGDGVKRLLALALHLSASQDGFLLVDEIDTGLHHKAMADMWRMVIGTARRLNVQVLATTHSLDCVHALAWVHESNPDLADDVTLHRVERDRTETVSYTAEELAIAARHHIEVR